MDEQQNTTNGALDRQIQSKSLPQTEFVIEADGPVDGMEAAAVWVDVAHLKAWDKNPRDNDKAVPEVMASIKRFGFAAPIIARPNGEIIAGHTRLKAALELRLPRVPVRYMDLDPAEAHLLALADNRVAEIADWDDDLLSDVLRELEGDGVDLKGIGWDVDELAMMLDGSSAVPGDEWSEALGLLPEGERSPIEQMTFTLHTDQAEAVREAIAHAKQMGQFVETGNENENGNALSRICETFLTGAGDG